MSKTEQEIPADDSEQDLRYLLLQLYLKNNPRLEHSVFIYSFQGVLDAQTNPFQYVSGKLQPNVRKSIILQNLASGEMMQAFIMPVKLENGQSVMQIALDSAKIAKTDKYRQFLNLAQSLMYQFY